MRKTALCLHYPTVMVTYTVFKFIVKNVYSISLQIVTRVPQKTTYQQQKNNKIESNKEKHRKLLTFNCLWLLFQGTSPVCTDIP